MSAASATPRAHRDPPRAPALLMGLGLGGFIDGIVLHQVLQWHHMLTSTGDYPMTTVAGLEANTLADGFFHLSTWLLVSAASWLTWRAWRDGRFAPPWRTQVGMLLAGWGLFNVAEGSIDHEILGIHPVRDDLGNENTIATGLVNPDNVAWPLGQLAQYSCIDRDTLRQGVEGPSNAATEA